MEKLPFFYFKEHSSLDFGLYIKEKGVYKGAERDVSYTSVAGRSGDLITDNGRYKNVKIPYKLALLNSSPRSFTELVHLIKNWLLVEPGYFKLWDTYDREYFRLASFSDEVDIEQELRVYGELDITFNCNPYKYLTQGQTKITGTGNDHIYNPEAYASEPYIKIYGSGTCYVYINNVQLKINNVSGYVEVDSEMRNCYKGSTALNNKMVGDFPTLKPGDNHITTGTGVTAIEIIPRWRTI